MKRILCPRSCSGCFVWRMPSSSTSKRGSAGTCTACGCPAQPENSTGDRRSGWAAWHRAWHTSATGHNPPCAVHSVPTAQPRTWPWQRAEGAAAPGAFQTQIGPACPARPRWHPATPVTARAGAQGCQCRILRCRQGGGSAPVLGDPWGSPSLLHGQGYGVCICSGLMTRCRTGASACAMGKVPAPVHPGVRGSWGSLGTEQGGGTLLGPRYEPSHWPHWSGTGLVLVTAGAGVLETRTARGGGQHGSDQQASHERGRAAGSSLNKRSFVWGMFCLSQQHPGWVPPTGRATPSPGTTEAWAGGTWWCRGMATCPGWDAQSWALPGQPLLPGPFRHPSAHQPTCSPAIQRRR